MRRSDSVGRGPFPKWLFSRVMYDNGLKPQIQLGTSDSAFNVDAVRIINVCITTTTTTTTTTIKDPEGFGKKLEENCRSDH